MANLVAVNVGLPKDVPWHGQTVHTGVWKRAVSGPQMVRKLNIDGDGQGDLAGHGGEFRAVLVYQIDSYRHWQQELGRPTFEYGEFGENFTVDGLPDDEVCIGDQYRIGEALFEVTQPRVTCYRVGMRMNEPRMAALLVEHRRPGFYLRVLTEGRVTAGDDVVKVATGAEAMTVADIDELLYRPGHPRDALVRALRIPALSPGWQKSFEALLEQADSGRAGTGNPGLATAAGSPPPAWSGFRPLRVVDVEAESASVFSLRLAAPDVTPLPSALPGQFLTVCLPAGPDGAQVVRSYSLSSRPGAADYRISVKEEPLGVASRYLRSHVGVGRTLDVAAPRGTFTLREGTDPVLLLSAGVGATPVLAMLQALVAQRSEREIWWLYGARNGSEHPFAEEVRRLLAALPGARSHICYSHPAPGDRLGIDYTSPGHLSEELLGQLGVPRSIDAYLCGPPAFMRDVPGWLSGYGIDADRVHAEIFGAGPALTPGIASQPATAPHDPDGPAGSGPSVAFARSGLTVNWDPRFPSLLDMAEACSVPVRWSCRTGVCHTCETGLLAGSVDYSLDPVEPPADGNVLICCSQPTDAIVLDL